MRYLLSLPIRFYQRFVSPWTPPSCRFRPTCSAYAIEAIEVHGVLLGPLLGLWRILRCQPFARCGDDPVPPRGAWRSAFRRRARDEAATDRTDEG